MRANGLKAAHHEEAVAGLIGDDDITSPAREHHSDRVARELVWSRMPLVSGCARGTCAAAAVVCGTGHRAAADKLRGAAEAARALAVPRRLGDTNSMLCEHPCSSEFDELLSATGLDPEPQTGLVAVRAHPLGLGRAGFAVSDAQGGSL